jgi:hypothetical protein
MAEFLLGRIKFVYQGNWTASNQYLVDDVVTNGGKTYICRISHVAAGLFITDFNLNKWSIISDGIQWRGDWTPTTLYNFGDIVKNDGIIYYCNTAHTSATTTTLGLEDDSDKWNTFVEGFYNTGDWQPSTIYHLGDIVTYGGISYYCSTYHTSAATIASGLESDIGSWTVFNAGVYYAGAWSGSSVRYRLNDVVKYGANLWICTTYHTSTGTTIDAAKFAIFTNGIEYANQWNNSSNYIQGDVVTYGGNTYIAKSNNLNYLPTDTSKWAVLTQGLLYSGEWSIQTSYTVGKVVNLHGYTYVSILDSTAYSITATATNSSADTITVSEVSGLAADMMIQFASSFAGVAGSTNYYITAVTGSSGSGTIQISTTIGGSVLDISSTLSGQTIATYAQYAPPKSTVWARLNSGLQWVNSPQTYTGVSTTNVTVGNVAASGVQFTVLRSGTTYTLTKTSNGSNYSANDIIKILGTDVGGLSPANDITITVSSVSGSAVNLFTYSGISATWSTGINYVQGDIATFGVNSYISQRAHLSITANRPDNDTVGFYWNLLSAGAETSTLTTQGDMVYYGPTGPTRLPVGTNGQILRVSNGYPVWGNYGFINDVVFVGPTGTDSPYPTNGATIDVPWATLKYALKQVEDGYLNPQAQFLLKINKQFLMQETYNYVTYTYKASVTGTSGSSFTTASTAGLNVGMPVRFSSQTGSLTINGNPISNSVTYYIKTISPDTSFTVAASYGGSAVTAGGTGTATVSFYTSLSNEIARDAGLVLDAVIWDIGHNGNYKTVTAAIAYFDSTGTTYVNTNVGYQVTQFIGALNYLSIIIGNVLANTAPVNYQSLNGVSAGNTAYQQINTSYTAETGSTTLAQSLVSIVTTGLSKGSTAAIPTATTPNTSVFVKTGTYDEVLPVVVPAYTAVIGDELRSTVVRPKTANSALVNDKAKTVASLTRIQSVLTNLISNSTVTPTTGNTQTQIKTLAAGDTGSYASPSFSASAVTAGSPGYITVADTSALTVGMPVVFSGTGTMATGAGITMGTTYYVKTIISSGTFSITTATPVADASTAVTLTSQTGGTLTVTYGYSAVASTVNNSTVMYNIVNSGLGSVPSLVMPWPVGYNTSSVTNTAYTTTGNATGVSTGYGYGAQQVIQNYNFLQANCDQYLSNNYSTIRTALTSTNVKAMVGRVLDGIVYDMIYGGNSQSNIAGSEYYSYTVFTIQVTSQTAAQCKTAMAAMYNELKSEISTVITKGSVSAPAGQVTYTQVTGGTAGSANAASFAQDRVTNVVNWINNGTADTAVAFYSAGATTLLNTAYAAVVERLSEIQSDGVVWVQKYYPSLSFNSATCSRDVGYIATAIANDLTYSSNAASAIAARRYYAYSVGFTNTSAQTVISSQKTAELGMINFLLNKIKPIAGVGAVARASSIIDDIIYYANGTQFISGQNVQYAGTLTYSTSLSTTKGAEIIRANKEFLAYEASAYITQSYGGTVSSLAITNNLINTSSAHNFVAGDPVVFTGTSAGGITTGTTYYVLAANLASTAFSVTATQGSTTAVTITSNVSSPSLTVRYSFSGTTCRQYIRDWVDAIVYDMQYPGNYRSLRTADLYLNDINGSLLSNMFLLRNATGLRNMTLSGLTGSLSAANSYGTKRPTAGAYASLDPGFGPNDSNAWIYARSPYAQNLSVFGTGCIGQKIDGALHAGGNRSIVSNDYTTIISDGIGIWCTGHNSLVEAVSVFSYYNYAGYLAELGGRIRATNGNSSYGTYGVIAEGVDSTETPIYATLNNHASQAYITNVFTDGSNKVLRLEYQNAGTNYSNAAYTISGTGYNAAAIGDEFRDNAVFETRLTDNGDATTTSVGGTSYVTAASTAQTGDRVSITVSAADTSLSTAYVGMRINITAGTGVGQTAAILTYSNGSKVATVYKESFTTLTITATTQGSPSTVTVASTATLYVTMPFYVATTVGGLTAGVVYYVQAIASATTFNVSATSGGAALTTAITTTTAQSVTFYAAGWDHVVPGTTISATLDLTTTYLIEPRITYTGPGFTSTALTVPSAAYTDVTFGAGAYVAINTSGTVTAYSTNGTSWGSAGAVTNTTWMGIQYGGGEGATATAVVGGLGGSGAVLTAVLGSGATAGQVVSVTVVNGGAGYTTSPSIAFTAVSGGSGATATAVVLNGAITQVTVTVGGSSYGVAPTVAARTDIITSITVNTYGKNYTTAPTVTVSGGGSSNQATATATLSNNGVASIAVGNNGGTGYTSQPTVTIVDTNAKFIAVPASGGAAASYQTLANLGSSWSTGSGNVPAGTYADITFGVQGGGPVWMAVGGAGTASITANGNTWTTTAITSLGAGTWSGVAFGNSIFVAVATGSQTTAVYTAGVWAAGGNMPTSTTWTSIAYGNGRFVALAASGAVAYSIDGAGATWTAAPSCSGATTSILSSSLTWTRVAYGQGLFIAIAQGTSTCATSPDGINWTLRTLSGSINWKGIVFGSISNYPMWASVANTSGTAATSIFTGATAQGRMKAASGAITEIRMIEPGSGYPYGSITATTTSTNVITTSSTRNLADSQPIEFTGLDSYGLITNTTYYVIGSTIVTNTSFKVSATAGSATAVSLSTGTGLTASYRAGPIITQTDPNKVKTASTRVRMGVGALANPTFSNRGTANTAAVASVSGDGYSDLYQPSTFISISGLYSQPTAGANVQFASIPNTWFKLVSVTNLLGSLGNYTATFQINPSLSVANAPAHGDTITTRLKYSQVRLTGHDFLYIGTGNQVTTNYPNVDTTTAITANQTYANVGGRVFFTSTDQDGNFNVGNLFGVQQATGTATLNASAFNLSGLQSLQLGSVSVGVASAVITQFSTDPYFTANSDNIVPTQKAIKSYITSQIGGGQSQLNVNTLTAGVIYVAGNTISTTSGGQIKVTAKMNFTGGIDGAPVAMGFFMQR